VIRRLGSFTGVSLVFWALVALPAHHFWGMAAAVHSAVALGLCMVPATLTLAWAGWAVHRSPEQQLLMVLGGTGLRMFLVLTAGLALYLRVDYFRNNPGFWAWILVFYLFTLALEMTLVLRGRSAAGSS
jgi:hypothetical protein